MQVTEIFNKMASDYDDIQDLWYAWLFSRLHFLIAKHIIFEYRPNTVLDVGCGTGFQSYLHAISGASVVGIDIANELIEVANNKKRVFQSNKIKRISLFPSYFDFVNRYNKIISSFLINKRKVGKYIPPCFQVADARYIPFPNNQFDHVNCCGSTLNFVEPTHTQVVLSEMARVLKPGGTLLLEIESRWNLDLFWAIVDIMMRGKLGYNTTLHEALKAIISPPTDHITIQYPFSDCKNQTPVSMKLQLLTMKRLEYELSRLQLKVSKRWSIHPVTNLIPSKYLGLSNPPKWIRRLFSVFTTIEERIPTPLPSCSQVLLSHKSNG